MTFGQEPASAVGLRAEAAERLRDLALFERRLTALYEESDGPSSEPPNRLMNSGLQLGKNLAKLVCIFCDRNLHTERSDAVIKATGAVGH